MYSTVYALLPELVRPYTAWIMMISAILLMVTLSLIIHFLFVRLNNEMYRVFVDSHPKYKEQAKHSRRVINNTEFYVQGIIIFLQVYLWMDTDFDIYISSNLVPDFLRGWFM